MHQYAGIEQVKTVPFDKAEFFCSVRIRAPPIMPLHLLLSANGANTIVCRMQTSFPTQKLQELTLAGGAGRGRALRCVIQFQFWDFQISSSASCRVTRFFKFLPIGLLLDSLFEDEVAQRNCDILGYYLPK
jgi:hypothetical protein